MRFGRRKITYYDTEAGFEAEKFAARLLLLLMNEMRASGRRRIVFLCIGTDRSTGDSLGPLIGSKLVAEVTGDVTVIGTLEHPVHAVNLDRTIEEMEEHYPDAIIVAVDAAVGRWVADHRETCRKLFRSDCAVLTCFADLPCYTSERIRRSAFTWFA